METLEELKAIIAGKPEGAEFYDSGNVEYIKFNGRIPMFHDARGWHMFKWPCKLRSLSDIERIIELMELNKSMHSAVAGYLSGDEWSHWHEFNAGKFKL